MILNKILKIIFIVSLFIFYLFYGIYLLKYFNVNIIELYIFIISYSLLGFTLINVFLVSLYWDVLSKKKGPPGPLGLKGDEGEQGNDGFCSSEYNIMYALLKVKESVADVIKNNSNLKIEDVYNKDNNKLINDTYDRMINRIIQSKEFSTLLFKPEENNNNLKYGKTLRELIMYIKSIINEWSLQILKLNKGQEFFKTFDANFTLSTQIENYYKNEILKYDIWYWGSRKPFRPLEIEVMRQTEFMKNNSKIQNSAFPIEDKPAIDVLLIDFTDYNKDNLTFLWNGEKMPDTLDNFNDWEKGVEGIYSNFILPEIYIPKIQKRNGRTFYPITCIMLEGDEDNKTNTMKYTILVSGDVVIPDRFTNLWRDRKQKHSTKGDGRKSDGKYAGMFWRLESSNSEYRTLGDIFWSREGDVSSFVDRENNLRLLKERFKFNEPDKYEGIVALPLKYLKEVDQSRMPIWSYRFRGSGDRFYRSKHQVDIFTNANFINSPIIFNVFLRLKNAAYSDRKLSYAENNLYGPDTPDGGKFYDIEYDKLNLLNNPLKDLEIENSDLGFGYYGYPHLTDNKYSIFNFLGLVPEGMIVNVNNNRKLYIKHYGGKDINRFNIFKFNTETNKFDKALKAITATDVEFGILKETDLRYSFLVEVDNNNDEYIRFKSYKYPGAGYLSYITNITNTHFDKARGNRPGGVTIDHTKSIFKLTPGKGPINNNNNKLFKFITATGMTFNKKNKRVKVNDAEYPGSNLKFTNRNNEINDSGRCTIS